MSNQGKICCKQTRIQKLINQEKTKSNQKVGYFTAAPKKEADMEASIRITKEMCGRYNDVFDEIRCFRGMLCCR